MMERPRTLGELKKSGYRSVDVKTEMRSNLIRKLRRDEPVFEGILGYDETVFPQIQNAILSRHDILLLGLRGQAKTRMLRQLVTLLDDAIPIVAGSEVRDDPLAPISRYARERIAQLGDETPIAWIGRDERYSEKLATPDVTIADLIGEIDMIKHAEGRYLSDELTMHYGLVPRANRGIFCMNELPDLAPKIQVGLFNVLEERDVQIRGFPVRLRLDLCLVFSANPEDYTNRGRIVTPLKDRIGSVVRTHYPLTREIGMAITEAEAWSSRDDVSVVVPYFLREIIEEMARVARSSPAINQQSGVSVRMSIANMENLVSNAERRGLSNQQSVAVARMCDLLATLPSSRGKIELTLSEDDGYEDRVLLKVAAEAVKNIFDSYFDVKSLRPIVEWFDKGHAVAVGDRTADQELAERVASIPALRQAAESLIERSERSVPDGAAAGMLASAAEFILEGLHVHNRLNKNMKSGESAYRRS